ncbi:hypothetical protein OG455_39045 [Kitasatospora sp. NBC_01287]|uniref:hypothetical protein n=1 Tax=Kitasatospora sp. NBC_01287 TaxID=2903573 RepID=UPI00224FBB06|nr:hypothetical protein [Kitasatospora sp. NBC_01287]MCX4751433.1 hypothetical protein [Kitasatospora sp. NBC_01287]
MKDWLNANPVKARAAVVALLTVLGTVVPKLAGIETNEEIIGLLLAAAAMAGGHSAGKQVVTHATDAARTDAARTTALAECCACPHEDPVRPAAVESGGDGMKIKR